jgi:hypothetical protein
VSAPDNVAVHASHPSGREGYVLLLFRPDAEGRVRFREWSSVDWTAPGREDVVPASELRRRIDGWVRDGWALTESPLRLAHWLTHGA